METIEIKNHPKVCDEIKFQLKGNKLETVDFFRQEKAVLIEIKNILTGLTIKELEKKIYQVSINPEVTLILKELLLKLQEKYKISDIKSKIMAMKKPSA